MVIEAINARWREMFYWLITSTRFGISIITAVERDTWEPAVEKEKKKKTAASARAVRNRQVIYN